MEHANVQRGRVLELHVALARLLLAIRNMRRGVWGGECPPPERRPGFVNHKVRCKPKIWFTVMCMFPGMGRFGRREKEKFPIKLLMRTWMAQRPSGIGNHKARQSADANNTLGRLRRVLGD
jgi:hypothetical protein